MKVLFVGEGAHDVGRIDRYAAEVQGNDGVVQTLVRKVCPAIDADSPSLRWTEITRFGPKVQSGHAAKVAAAIALSARKYGCTGTVVVTDCDRDPTRLAAMNEGRDRGRHLAGPSHKAVCALAVESIDAWTLGATEALAAELDVPLHKLRAAYPKAHVEKLFEQSGKLEQRPKGLLQRLAQLAHRDDGLELRRAVAQRTDIEALKRACPAGFQPFAEALAAAFAVPEA